MTRTEPLIQAVFGDVLRGSHDYAAGRHPNRPTLTTDPRPNWRRNAAALRELARDAWERSAARIELSRAHFDAAEAGARLARVAELSAGLQETYDRLADEPSRRALRDVLKLRVLGPYHAHLAVTPDGFRTAQARVDREHRVEAGTYAVSDPWFSPLSRYRVPLPQGGSAELHAHSVDLVSVYMLEQYRYARGGITVGVREGDVVLDIGGCWGDTALYFAALVGERGKVFTFEFDPESLEILNANLSLNPGLADRIEVVERAAWERSGEILEFTQAGRCTAIRPDQVSDRGRTVVTITVDDFVREAGLDRVDFVKMDIEGVEARALGGARHTLATMAPRLGIAAYHRDDDLITIPRQILAAQDAYRLYLASYSPLEDETVLFADATSLSSAT